MAIVEIESVSLPRELRQYRNDERWVAYTPAGFVSEVVSYSDAIRIANGIGGAEASVGFVPDDYQPAAPVKKIANPRRLLRKAHGRPN